MHLSNFWRILPCALLIVALLGCSGYRKKYSNLPPDDAARKYLALSPKDRAIVDRELTSDERRRLNEAIDGLNKPTPTPEPEEEPVAENTPAPEPPPVEKPPAQAPPADKPPAPAPPPPVEAPPVAAPPVDKPPAPAPPAPPAPPPPAVEGPVVFEPDLSPRDFLDNLFRGKGDTHSRLYIPGYAYFQGAIGSGANVTVAGQVRVIGGVTGGTGNLGNGAMVTTNPDYLDGKVTPGRHRFRIVEWKEVD